MHDERITNPMNHPTESLECVQACISDTISHLEMCHTSQQALHCEASRYICAADVMAVNMMTSELSVRSAVFKSTWSEVS
jgi:hypothetical protein